MFSIEAYQSICIFTCQSIRVISKISRRDGPESLERRALSLIRILVVRTRVSRNERESFSRAESKEQELTASRRAVDESLDKESRGREAPIALTRAHETSGKS